MRNKLLGLGLALAAAGTLLAPAPAQAWWHHRPHWGVGVFIGPPIYYPPPPYYVSPYYAPPYYPPPPATEGCYAGPYVCPLQAAAPVGTPCSCRTNDGGQAWGRAR